MNALDVALTLLALPVLLATGYLGWLALQARPRPPPAAVLPSRRFAIVVPAHDEEPGISSTVASLLAVDYPAALRRVLVVADNCSDETAGRARAAGAEVLERTDATRRGKGFALAYAYERLLEEGWADAIVVVDADTVVLPNLLRAFSARLGAGAQAVQAEYGVRNPDASWRTRLMTIALATFNRLRSLARERRGLSCGLHGNGMCFTRQVLTEVPHRAYSIVEDLEYGLRLGEAGYRVHYADDAAVLGEMVSTSSAAASQRRRWETGKQAIARREGLRLLKRAIGVRDRVLLDMALGLLVPPLTTLAAASALGTALAAVLAWTTGESLALYAWGATALALVAYVFRGWQLSRTGLRGAFTMLAAPVYAGWKLALKLERRARASDEWVRTQRERQAS